MASNEDAIYNLETQAASGKAAVSHSGRASRKDKSCHASGSLGRSDAGSGSSAEDSGTFLDAGLNLDTQSGKTHVSFTDKSHTAEPLCLVSGHQQSESSGQLSCQVCPVVCLIQPIMRRYFKRIMDY